jgi:molybdopterin-dependent oxidoreductase alpha subunit
VASVTFFSRILYSLKLLVPFGLLFRTKPRHFREMLVVLWENRRRLPYALRILRHGVCDGCSLGPRGLKDDVIPGLHLCLTRLKLLRLNTMGSLKEEALRDVRRLRTLSNEELHRLGRVPYPLLRRNGEQGFSRISWEEASGMVADKMRRTDADAMGMFVTSRGLTNETYYVLQKLWRIGGSPHIDACARLCHAASSIGLKQTIGWAAPTLSLSDLIGSNLVFIIGSNLPNNQPVSTKYLRAARRAGTRIVVVNPFREPALERYWIPSVPTSALFGTKLMDDYFPVRPGGDIAFLSGVLKALDEIGGWDESYVGEHTVGAPALRADLARVPWCEIVDDSGIEEAEIRKLATMYASAKTAVIVYSMGLTQYEFGVENVKMVVNLALARGMIGREKCGILPIRGHSGVQGTAECGADADKLPGGVDIDNANCARFERAWEHPIPHRAGLRAAHLLDRAGDSGLELLYLVGGNHLETMPDRKHAQRALENVGLRVHQDIVLNTTTLLDAREAVLVLPAQTRYEQRSGGTSTSTERRIRFTPEIPGPRLAEAKPEWQIPAMIGQQLRPDRADLFSYQDTGAIRREMARLMPLYAGIERLEKEGDWVQWGGARLGSGGFPNMKEGRARFSVVKIPRIDVPAGQFLLTLRRGKQFNSMSYGARDPLTAGAKRTDVLLDARDIRALSLHDGDAVRLESNAGTMTAHVKAGPCRRQHAQGYFPEANVLVSRKYDPASGEPDYATTVKIERMNGGKGHTPEPS